MRVFGHLFKHKVAVFIVLVLLVAQAACDLALPKYTSDIVDIGIQQSGVEHITAEVMTPKTHDAIALQLTGEQKQVFLDSYDLDGDLYRLNSDGSQRIQELDEIIALPLIEAHKDDIAEPSHAGNGIFAQLSEEANDSLIKQQAHAATIAEYEDANYDLTGMQMGYLARVGLAMALIAALGMLISILISFVAARTGATIGRDLRSELFSRVVSFTEKEIDRFSAASLITRGTNDVQLIQMTSIMMLRMVLYAPILAIGGIIMVMATSPSLGWIIVVAIVCVFGMVAILFGLTLPRFKVMQQLIDRVNLVAREMLSGMPVVRAFDREKHEEVRFDEASTKLMRTQLFTNRAMTFMMPTMMLIMNATSVAIVWFGGLAVQDGSIQTGDLIAFITYAMVIIMSFLMLGMIAIILPRANVAAARIDEVIHTMPAVEDPAPNAKAMPSEAIDSQSPGAQIEFDDVSFCYDEDGECENVLSHISFTVEPGQTLAIVGATGSGKSTILKLIERFYDVTEGSVRIDGIDVRDIAQADLRSQLGYVPQKAFLFSGTIASNVAYSDESMPEQRISQALKIAQADEIIVNREGGVEAEISQGGTNVSGGQRQRIAIARAVATKARVFLFDDSFSALDYKTDSTLRAALRKHLGDVTVIIVAQRIATVMNADKIVVLDEGHVAGIGTHENLMKSCEEYREIALSQLSAEELSIGGEAV